MIAAAVSVALGLGCLAIMWTAFGSILTGQRRAHELERQAERALLDHALGHRIAIDPVSGEERLRAVAELAPPRDPVREAQEREDARLERYYQSVMAISLEPRPIVQHADDTDALITRIGRELNRAEWDKIAAEDRKAGRPPRGIKTTLPPVQYSPGGVVR